MSVGSSAITLGDAQLPQLFRSADTLSGRSQRQYINGTAAQLLLLVAAAAAAKLPSGGGSTNWGQVTAALCFLCAAILRTLLLPINPESRYYESRAVAESVKTLAWRYAVGGDPFRVDEVEVGDADRIFYERVREYPRHCPTLPSGPLA